MVVWAGLSPFASISIKGRTTGTTADAEGRFQLRTSQIGDSLLVTSLGFWTKAVALLTELTHSHNPVRLAMQKRWKHQRDEYAGRGKQK